MKKSKGVILCMSLIILTIILTGCIGGESSKDKEIKQSFAKSLEMYPTKNLEDFYDMEGSKNDHFKKGDKGIWVIHSAMNMQKKGQSLKTRGMVLNIDRNTRDATGYFMIRNIKGTGLYEDRTKTKKYPVKMVNNKIIPTEKIKDKKLKQEIEGFKFFVQYGNFKGLEDNQDGEISYNPNAPTYSTEYQLKNSNYNVRQLRKRYDVPTDKAPKLLLNGTGGLEGKSMGYKRLEVRFSHAEDEEGSVYFTDSINFNPSKDIKD